MYNYISCPGACTFRGKRVIIREFSQIKMFNLIIREFTQIKMFNLQS